MESINQRPPYGDGVLRSMWRIATFEPEETWPAHVIVQLVEEIIRLRGTDTAWMAVHPPSSHVHFRGDEPHSHDPYVHQWGAHKARISNPPENGSTLLRYDGRDDATPGA